MSQTPRSRQLTGGFKDAEYFFHRQVVIVADNFRQISKSYGLSRSRYQRAKSYQGLQGDFFGRDFDSESSGVATLVNDKDLGSTSTSLSIETNAVCYRLCPKFTGARGF
jgi:hypothetical protein